MKRVIVVMLSSVAFPAAAFADCIVKNETTHSFDVETAGHHHPVAPHKEVHVEVGPIHAKRDDGVQVDGVCKEGEHVKIVEVAGKLEIKHDDAH